MLIQYSAFPLFHSVANFAIFAAYVYLFAMAVLACLLYFGWPRGVQGKAE